MNPGRYYMPYMGMRMNPNLGMNANGFVFRDNIFNRMFNGIKSINWSSLLNNANRTLNVVNQTIPLIRQTKPMISNMRNMISLAKAFKKETTTEYNNHKIKINNKDTTIKKEVTGGLPNFFI